MLLLSYLFKRGVKKMRVPWLLPDENHRGSISIRDVEGICHLRCEMAPSPALLGRVTDSRGLCVDSDHNHLFAFLYSRSFISNDLKGV